MKYEGSAADNRKDKAGAKKAAMSMKAWEKSPMDAKIDKAGAKKMAAKKAKKKK